jgi:hypothetical protein
MGNGEWDWSNAKHFTFRPADLFYPDRSLLRYGCGDSQSSSNHLFNQKKIAIIFAERYSS